MRNVQSLIAFVYLLAFPKFGQAQCTWHTTLYDSFEYQSPCPDVIPGTVYNNIPQSWAVNTGNYSLYLNFVNCNGGTGTCAGDTVYRRVFEVCPNIPNRVTAMLATTFSGLQCDVQIMIIDGNNNVLSNTPSIPADYAPVWTQFQAAFISPTPTVTFLMITNTPGAQGGNDLSMDDFRVENCYSFSLGPDTTICSTETLTLDAGSGNTSYLWNDSTVNQTYDAISSGGVADTNYYFVQVTNSSGCILNSDTITVIFEICDGIIYPSTDNELNITAFPAGHQILVRSISKPAEARLNIYDVKGALLIEVALEKTDQLICLPGLGKGIYFYAVVNGNRLQKSGKFVFE